MDAMGACSHGLRSRSRPRSRPRSLDSLRYEHASALHPLRQRTFKPWPTHCPRCPLQEQLLRTALRKGQASCQPEARTPQSQSVDAWGDALGAEGANKRQRQQ